MKRILIFWTFFQLLSCNNQTLDLSQVRVNEDAKAYNLDKLKVYKKEEQKGHYEVKYNGNIILPKN